MSHMSGVASFEELWARFLPPELCCFFRGSVMALDVKTGAILWRTYTAPPNPPAPNANDGYTGNAVWGSTPAIDPSRGQLYVATGNNYSVPDSLLTCIAEHPNNAESCVDPTNHFDSIMALDLETGAIRWVTRALPLDAWNVSCGIPFIFEDVTVNCPEDPGPDWDFGQGPSLFTVTGHDGKPARSRRRRSEEWRLLGTRSEFRRSRLEHAGVTGRAGWWPAMGLSRRR